MTYRALLLLLAAPAAGQATTDHRGATLTVGGGGYVAGVVASSAEEGLFYARTDVGDAYRWEDATDTWTPLTDWIPERQVGLLGIEAIALDPQAPNRLYLLAGTSYWSGGATAILRSDDYGETFDVLPTTGRFRAHGNGMGRQNGERLAVDPHDGDVLLAGTRRDGLFVSADRGDTWEHVDALPVSTTPNENGIAFVVLDPAHVTDGRTQRIYVGVSRTGDNLYASDDAGASWTAIEGGPGGRMPQRAALARDGTLFVTYGNGAGPHLYAYDPPSAPRPSASGWRRRRRTTRRSSSGAASTARRASSGRPTKDRPGSASTTTRTGTAAPATASSSWGTRTCSGGST